MVQGSSYPRSSSSLSRRRLLTTAGAGAAALAGGAHIRPRPAAAQDAVTLRWLTDLPNAQVVADRFTETNPDVKIEVETVTFREVFQQNQVRLGAKSDDLDIVSVDAPVVAGYGLRGWLLPLDDAFTPEETSAWVGALNDSGRYNGSLLAPPIWNSSQLLFYNLDLLEAAGVTPPAVDERWTWDQLATAAQALTHDDVFGFQFEQFNRIYQLQPLPQGKGVPVIGEDGLTVKGIIDSPEWIEAFTWYADAHNKTKISYQGNLEPEPLFLDQKLAMVIRGPWAIKSFIDQNPTFQWRAAPHPYWGGPIHVPTDSWHLGVNAASKNPEATTRFIKYASSIEGGRVWREVQDIWPAQQILLDEIFNDPANVEWPNQANVVAAAEAQYATARPLTPGYLEYEEILSDAFEDMRNGSDVADSLSGAADSIDREMEKYRQ